MPDAIPELTKADMEAITTKFRNGQLLLRSLVLSLFGPDYEFALIVHKQGDPTGLCVVADIESQDALRALIQHALNRIDLPEMHDMESINAMGRKH